MFQLRIYTLRSPEALQQYATVHWARHLAAFKTFGITPTVCGQSEAAARIDSSR
jgi:hypothetical protein